MLNGDGVDNLNFNIDYFINRVKNSVFVRNVSLTVATKAAIVIVSFFSSIITARYLGPKGRGILVVLMSFVAIGTQFGNFGLHSANTYFVAKKEELLPRIVGNTLWLSLGGGLLISMIMLIVLYFNPELAPGIPFLLIVISIVTVPFGLFFMLGENILIGVHQIKLFNFFEFINRILPFFVITLLLVFFGQKVEAVVVSIAILTILLTILLFERLRALTGKKISFDFFLLKEMLAYGIKAYLAALFSFLVIRFDMLMVNYYLSSKQAGVYSIAVQIGDIIYLFPVTVGMMLFPKVSKMERGSWNFTKRVVLATAVMMVFICLSAGLLAQPFISFFYGEAFKNSVKALWWLLPGIFSLSISTIYMNFLAGKGMPLVAVIIPLIAFLANFILNLFMIPLLGISGASLSSSLAYTSMLAVLFIYFIKKARYYEPL